MLAKTINYAQPNQNDIMRSPTNTILCGAQPKRYICSPTKSFRIVLPSPSHPSPYYQLCVRSWASFVAVLTLRPPALPHPRPTQENEQTCISPSIRKLTGDRFAPQPRREPGLADAEVAAPECHIVPPAETRRLPPFFFMRSLLQFFPSWHVQTRPPHFSKSKHQTKKQKKPR